MNPRKYICVEVTSDPGQREELEILLWELGSIGFEELDQEGFLKLLAYFDSTFSPEELEVTLVERLLPVPDALFRLHHISFDADAWLEAYTRQFRAFEVSPTFFVYPSWGRPSPDHPVNIQLDPGHGFGTGSHESTQLALLAVEQAFGEEVVTSMVDVGTGSGILSIAAARLRPDIRIVALDKDPLSMHAALNGFRTNRLSIDLAFAGEPHSLRSSFDLVVANLTCAIFRDVVNDLVRLCRRQLVISGFTAEESDTVLDLFCSQGSTELRRSWTLNGWNCFLLRQCIGS